jgi:hypothetical protein
VEVSREIERRILPEHLLLEFAEVLSGLEPELFYERPSGVLVRVERLGLPSRAIERKQPLPDQALSRRVLTSQRLELAHEVSVPGAGEIVVDSIFERRDPKFLEAGNLGLRKALVGKVRKRRASPDRERLVQTSLCFEALKSIEIELALVDNQHVSRRPALHPLLAEELPHLRDENLETFPGVGVGCSSQIASISRSLETTRFASSRSIARRTRCFCPPKSSVWPFDRTSSGPSRQNSYTASPSYQRPLVAREARPSFGR